MWEKQILLYIGIALILIAVGLSYNEYRSISKDQLPIGNMESSLSSILSVFTVEAVKAIFIAIIVWGGGILISNSLKVDKEKKPA